MQSYSETGIDRWISENIQVPDVGFYVDLGCAHPKQYSNTAWLRDKGWDGLAIDGSYQYADQWHGVRGARFLNAVIGDGPVVNWLNEKTNTLVSRLHPEGEPTNASEFGQMLVQFNVPQKFDFLAMDIEDSEPIALRQMFGAGFYPNFMVIEYHSMHGGRNPDTVQIPIQHGYQLRRITDSDVVYTR